MKKISYKIRNWPEYNKSLTQRGRLDVWIPETLVEDWFNYEKHGGKGASYVYTNAAIEFCYLIRNLYQLPLRQTRGFVSSIFKMANIPLQTPCYSTMSRRGKELEVCLREEIGNERLSVAFDATGIKVSGEGEWKVRTHGTEKRRGWTKLHIAINSDSQEILAAIVTGSDVHDGEVLADLLEQIPEGVKDGFGDGAYDSHENFKLLQSMGSLATIPPRENAVVTGDGAILRNEHVQEIGEIGRDEWNIKHKYHQRSKVETAMFRMKRCFGGGLTSKIPEIQAAELFIRCQLLNRFFKLGKPVTIAVTE